MDKITQKQMAENLLKASEDKAYLTSLFAEFNNQLSLKIMTV